LAGVVDEALVAPEEFAVGSEIGGKLLFAHGHDILVGKVFETFDAA
jgi:hypothetical protein